VCIYVCVCECVCCVCVCVSMLCVCHTTCDHHRIIARHLGGLHGLTEECKTTVLRGLCVYICVCVSVCCVCVCVSMLCV